VTTLSDQREPRTWHPNPKTPTFKVPNGAVDAHCHVFGPGKNFPYAKERKYTPQDASAEMLMDLHRHLGFERRVLVQASCHGTDNTAMVDCLKSDPHNSRGVAVVKPDIEDTELDALHAAGVRAVRFNFLRRLVDPGPLEPRMELAKRIADRGWHVVVYFEPADLGDLIPFFRELPTQVVIDHLGRPDISAGQDDQVFQTFLRLIKDTKFWIKVGCPERLTISGPPYADVIPFSKRVVELAGDRVLWGTDWPHPNMKSHIPDDGELVDLIPMIAPTASAQQALLVDNPTKLYWD
jgi:2-pyrone-4,6-dicarboxylate lactonase